MLQLYMSRIYVKRIFTYLRIEDGSRVVTTIEDPLMGIKFDIVYSESSMTIVKFGNDAGISLGYIGSSILDCFTETSSNKDVELGIELLKHLVRWCETNLYKDKFRNFIVYTNHDEKINVVIIRAISKDNAKYVYANKYRCDLKDIVVKDIDREMSRTDMLIVSEFKPNI